MLALMTLWVGSCVHGGGVSARTPHTHMQTLPQRHHHARESAHARRSSATPFAVAPGWQPPPPTAQSPAPQCARCVQQEKGAASCGAGSSTPRVLVSVVVQGSKACGREQNGQRVLSGRTRARTHVRACAHTHTYAHTHWHTWKSSGSDREADERESMAASLRFIHEQSVIRDEEAGGGCGALSARHAVSAGPHRDL